MLDLASGVRHKTNGVGEIARRWGTAPGRGSGHPSSSSGGCQVQRQPILHGWDSPLGLGCDIASQAARHSQFGAGAESWAMAYVLTARQPPSKGNGWKAIALSRCVRRAETSTGGHLGWPRDRRAPRGAEGSRAPNRGWRSTKNWGAFIFAEGRLPHGHPGRRAGSART